MAMLTEYTLEESIEAHGGTTCTNPTSKDKDAHFDPHSWKESNNQTCKSTKNQHNDIDPIRDIRGNCNTIQKQLQ